MIGCASGGSSPVILTNSQFKCAAKPAVPLNADMTTESGQKELGGYVIDMEVAYDLCQDRLLEIRDVIQVQGGIVTDVLVKERKKWLGLF